MPISTRTGNPYWYRHFPLEQLFELWSLHCPDQRRREFCFRAQSPKDGSTYMKRYVSVGTPAEFKDAMKRHDLKEVHVGAVYTLDSHLAQSAVTGCHSIGREFVIDLDLQDKAIFGEIPASNIAANDNGMRTLLLSANIVLAIIEEVYGFKNCLVSYSGRRGVHITVLDRRAYDMSNAQRDAIIHSMTAPVFLFDNRLLFHGSKDYPGVLQDSSFGLMSDRQPHTKTRQAFELAYDYLLKPRCEDGVGLLERQTDKDKLLDLLFDVDAKYKRADPLLQTKARQAAIDHRNTSGSKCLDAIRSTLLGSKLFLSRLEMILFSILWPKVDRGASSQTHLVKSEFSVHGETDRIAIPFVLDNKNPVWDPKTCPTSTALADGDVGAKEAMHAALQIVNDAISKERSQINERMRGEKRKRD